MKKSTKTLLFTHFVCLAAFFATSAQAQFSGGVKAGVNIATEQYPGFTMQNAILGYGGGYARYQVNLIAIQLEANYSNEGGNLYDTYDRVINQYRESYLNVPVFIQGRFPTGVYIEFGVQYGFLLSSSYDFNNTGTVNTEGAYKGGNFSVGGGAGYEFKNGLGINIRYMQGTTAISSSGFGDIKTSAFSFGLSEKF